MPVTAIYTTVNASGEVISQRYIYDDGKELEKFFSGGVLSRSVVSDLSNLETWTSIESTYDTAGNVTSKTVVEDSGDEVTETFDAAGNRTSRLQTDGDGSSDWETLELTFDTGGAILTREVTLDTGRIVLDTFSGGVKTSTRLTDVDDTEDWDVLETFFNAAGEITSKVITEDTGVVVTTEYSGGIVTSRTVTDPSAGQPGGPNWSEIRSEFDASGNLVRSIAQLDNGDLLTMEFSGGVLVSRTVEDIDDNAPWTSIRTLFNAAGDRIQVETTRDDGSVSVDRLNNTPPVAADLAFADPGLNEDDVATDAIPSTALTDADGDAVSVQSFDTTGLQGSLTDLGNGAFQYDPDGQFEFLAVGETATTSFTYTIVDSYNGPLTPTSTSGFGATDTGTVTLTIEGRNDAPVAGDDAFTVSADDAFATLGNVLTNDTDVDASDTLSRQDADATGILGSVQLLADGTFSYGPSGQFTGLAAGETATDTITYTVTDGNGGTDTGTVTVTIEGVEDPIVITGDSSGAASEDGVLSAGGTLTATDADTIDTPEFTPQTGTAGTYGSFSLLANGGWTYTLDNAAAQVLAGGETFDETFTAVATTADGETASQTMTVTVTGEEDPIVISGTTSSSIQEDGGSNAVVDTLVASDADGSDTPTFTPQSNVVGSYGTFGINAGGSWTFNFDNAAAQSLGAGETVPDAFQVTATTADGETATETITINVTGVNDDPTAVDDSFSVSEGATLDRPAADLIGDDTDPDGDTLSLAGVSATSTLGASVTVTNGGANFVYDTSGVAALEALPAGSSAQDTFTYTVSDGNGGEDTGTVTVTVNGSNDAAGISGDTTGAVVEDGTLTDTGTLTVTDVDTGEAGTQVQTNAAGTYGTFSVDDSGNWTYTLANTLAATQALTGGQVEQESFTVTSIDGTASETVTIDVTGANDTASFAGDTAGAVTEDDTLQATGTLTVTDVDTGEAGTQAQTNSAGTYGTFSVDTAGAWTYDLENANSAVQALGSGATLTDTFSVTSTDGTASQTVTITINGTTDPIPFSINFEDVTVPGSNAVPLDGTYRGFTWDAELGGFSPDHPDVADGTNLPTNAWTSLDSNVGISGSNRDPILISEVDGDDFRFDSIDLALQTGTAGNVTLNGYNGGVLQWAQTVAVGTNGFTNIVSTESGLIDALEIAGYSNNIAFDNIMLAQPASENAAAIGGSLAGAVTEDAGLIATGTLAVTDADAGENYVNAGAFTGTYGSFAVGADNEWIYTLDNANTDVQALNAGQTLTDIFTVTSADGTTQQVNITINGADEGGTQRTIDFEDLAQPTQIPDGYEGFDWIATNIGTFNLPFATEASDNFPGVAPGGIAAATSGERGFLNILASNGDAFEFVSIDLHGTDDTNGSVTLTGFNDGAQVATQSVSLPTTSFTTFTPTGWGVIDELRINGYQPLNGPDQGDIAIDNFIIA